MRHKHAELIKKYYEDTTATVYERRNGTWTRSPLPYAWCEDATYFVVPVDKVDMFEAYIAGELEILDGDWGLYTSDVPPDLSREWRKYIPHRELQAKAREAGAVVWVRGIEWQSFTDARDVSWYRDIDYQVVLPEYKDIWQWFLDGELETQCANGMWIDWGDDSCWPALSAPTEKYSCRYKHLKDQLTNGATLWVNDGGWKQSGPPFKDHLTYKVVGKEYLLLWSAWLEDHGCLQVWDDSTGWVPVGEPNFTHEPSRYRTVRILDYKGKPCGS